MTIQTSGRVLYPAGPGAAPVCWRCHRAAASDLAWTTDRRVTGGELANVCGPCHRAAVAGEPVDLPGAEELPELLIRWARWNVNGEASDEAVERMLAALLPGLPEDDRGIWFVNLQHALLELQDRTEPGFELASVEPEARDEEALIADAAAKVDEALRALIGGAA